MTATAGTRAAKTKRRLPILEGILPFDKARLPTEIIAGATLAALAMPEVMGYSKIAEMPVITGLYTLVLPMLAFAIFGSSRHLVVGADSATAALLAVGLTGIAAAGAPASPQWVAMAGLAALIPARPVARTAAVAESAPTTRCRDEPRSANASIGRTSV